MDVLTLKEPEGVALRFGRDRISVVNDNDNSETVSVLMALYCLAMARAIPVSSPGARSKGM